MCLEDRVNFLQAIGMTKAEREELLAYNQNQFTAAPDQIVLPLSDEVFVETWQVYLTKSRTCGLWTVLQEQLVQLRFPIQAEISKTVNYQAATKRGADTRIMPEATGLNLESPELLELVIHQTASGKIPMLITRYRPDFVSLVQALTKRNEPVPISDSMGAQMVAGFNNWGRIQAYRKSWEAGQTEISEEQWQEEFSRVIPRQELYQDRFIILSDGPYSAVPAPDLGLGLQQWKAASLVIRREHECTHYFTRRIFGSMRNNMLDELIADYMGIVAAVGRYRADWFLRFVGLDIFPDRLGGRINNYRGTPPLSDGAFTVLKRLVKMAAENIELFDRSNREKLAQADGTTRMLVALTCLTLEELASEDSQEFLNQALRRADHKVWFG